MEDRVSRHPYRIHLKAVPNKPDYFDIELADDPIKEGTPYNVASVLPEPLAKQFGLNPKTGTVAQVFDKLTNSVFGDNPAMLKNLEGVDIHPIWTTGVQSKGTWPTRYSAPFSPRLAIVVGNSSSGNPSFCWIRGGDESGNSLVMTGASGVVTAWHYYIDGNSIVLGADPGGKIAGACNVKGKWVYILAIR